MDWVLLVSLQWVVMGSPTQPTTTQIDSFTSQELCQKAAEAIKAEVGGSPQGQRSYTLSHVVCFARK
ncbi:MAG: hypothetical protein K2W78_16570 [Xanthobacteraceae bacterium]|nr:hypothetical protein [Xanthobacteraceae bacterium]